MESIKRATLPPGPVSIAFLGVGFARAWLTLVFVDPSSGASEATLPHGVFDLAYAALSFLCVLVARKIVPLSNGRRWYAWTLVGMLAASAAWVFGAVWGMPPGAKVAEACVGGAAYGAFLLLNAEAFAGLSILHAVLYLSGARVLGSVIAFFLDGSGTLDMAVALTMLPLVSVGLVHASYGSLPEANRQHAPYPRFSYPWKLVALVGIFSFVYGLRRASLAVGAGQHSSLSTALVMGAVFVAAYLFPNKVNTSRLCRLPLPLMACGLLFVPTEGLFGSVASSYLMSAAYTLMTFLVTILLYDMSRHTGVAVVPLIAGVDAMQVFVVLGDVTAGLVERAVPDGATVSLIMIGCALAALTASFALLFSDRELVSRWGIRVLQETSLEEKAQADGERMARCRDLAEIYQLTAREQEILVEIARGRDGDLIASKLQIAPGTLKAHTRHIYGKMGIHTRKELMELLGV